MPEEVDKNQIAARAQRSMNELVSNQECVDDPGLPKALASLLGTYGKNTPATDLMKLVNFINTL